MMKRHLLFTLCLLLAVHAKADPVTVEQARQKAAQFLQSQVKAGSRRRAPAAKELRMVAKGRADTYYVFNAANRGDGYVVVSGDDATESILGYSHTGTIDPDNMPCGMKMLLDGYAEEISYLRKEGLSVRQASPRKVADKDFRLEFRLTKYDQDDPYNLLCPMLNEIDHCATGCVATAMAGLLYYHQWPSAITSDIPAYNTDELNRPVSMIPANTRIEWRNIKDYYTPDDVNELGRDEIATLMLMCGASVRMDYNKESGAYNISVPYALERYFGYEAAVYDQVSNYNAPQQWEEKLRTELRKNGPVLYGGGRTYIEDGEEKYSSHTFLLEGYTTDGFFYVNWGWGGGSSDATLFKLSASDFRYPLEQDAVFGVSRRSQLSEVDIPFRLSNYNMNYDGTGIYHRSIGTGNFDNILISFVLANFIPVNPITFDYGVVFKNVKKQNYEEYKYMGNNTLPFNGGLTSNENTFFSYGANLTNGKYNVYMVSRETGKEEWLLNEYSDRWHLEAWVCGDKLSIKNTVNDGTNFDIISCEQTDEAPLRVGQEAHYELKVRSGVSPKLYDGAVLAKIVWTENGTEKDSVVYINSVTCVAGETTTMNFSFTPFVSGEQQLVILNKFWSPVGSMTISPVGEKESLNMLEMTNLRIEDYDEGRRTLDNTILNGAITLFNHDVVTHSRLVYVTLTEVETDKTKERPMIVSIPPNEHVTYNFKFSNLVEGHHYVFGAKYYLGGEIYHSEPFLCTNDESNDENIAGNERLRSFEYWFDDDFSHRNTISLGTRRAVVRASIDTDDLDDGFHTLYYRVQRDDDTCSAVSRSTFLKLTREHEGFFDYWIDDDEENKQRIALEDTEDEQLLTLDLSDNEQVPIGYHKLKYQVAVPGSIVSPVQTQGILKLSTGNATTLEYWYDDDFAGRQRLTEHTIESGGYVYASQLDMSHLPVGVHRLNMRAVSPSGITNGSVLTCRVVKMSNSVASKIECWYDDDMANSQILDGQINEGGYLFASQLDMSSLPVGLHKLNFRAVAANGFNPSPIVSCTVMKLPHGKVSQFEYWFDGDYAHSQIINLNNTNTNECLFANELNLSGIAPGHHRLYYRAIGPNSQISTAVGTAAIMVGALSRATEGAAVLASYSIEVDDVKVVANGKMNGRNVQDFRYILDASELSVGSHMLKASFWNSYGVGVTEQVPFRVIEWPTYIRGDVNDDGHVTITDVVAVVNYILGIISEEFVFKAADINGDGKITITDAVEIANIILNK